MTGLFESSVAIFDDVNERVIGSVPKSAVPDIKVNYRTTHVFVFDRHADMLLLQKLPKNHSRNPGKWGSSAATYCYALNGGKFEEYHAAALRALHDELGIRVNPGLKDAGTVTIRERNGGIKFTKLWLTRYSGALHPDYGKMAGWKNFALSEIRDMRSHDPEQFTSTFLECLDHYERILPTL